MLERVLYLIYLIEWKISHRNKRFKGCYPVCFNEWKNCELQDMIKNPGNYKNNWYYFIIDSIREKKSTEF